MERQTATTSPESWAIHSLIIARPNSAAISGLCPKPAVHTMQLNKERQKKIRLKLYKSLPADGSSEAELWQRNERLSLLLRLPPELRNRIYELVLYVGQIKVCYKKWEHRRRLHTETVEGGWYCRLLHKEQNPWDLWPLEHPQPPRGMTLLSPVCRQLHHETALLPFSLNAWSFESQQVMDRFVVKEKRLPMPHRRAIRLLYSQAVLTTAVEKYFGGLEVILLENNTRMTKHVIDVDPDHAGCRRIAWDITHPWWK